MVKLSDKLKSIKKQSLKLTNLTLSQRNEILRNIARNLLKRKKEIFQVNHEEVNALNANGSFKERLELNPKKLREMVASVKSVIKLPDPINRTLEIKKLVNGTTLKKISVPLGVVGVIYESRPNVTVDLAILAIKSGNAVVLKGGKESYKTNQVLVKFIHNVLKKYGLPTDLVYLIDPKTDWQKDLLQAYGVVDVLIPRGGNQLIEFVRKHAEVPFIETGAGVCHTYVDEKYEIKSAVEIIINAKTQRPSVCNALDTLVVHKKILKGLLQSLTAPLAAFEVEIRADQPSFQILKKIYPQKFLKKTLPSDYGKELLALVMAVKTVKNFQQALEFVKNHTSGHSEAILTSIRSHAHQFLQEIDASVVYQNASIRLTDGGEFGMGAEVGISTQKLHARGPMGLEALTSYKWVVFGQGQIRR